MINRILPNSFKTSILAGTLLLSAVSCGRGALHQIDNDHSITEAVDAFTKSELNDFDTQDLELFKIDTVKISEKEFDDFQRLNDRLTGRAIFYNPIVDSKSHFEYGFSSGKPRIGSNGVSVSPGMGFHMETELSYKYKDENIKAKVQNKVFANEKESKFYIPVEYYGKPDTTVVELKK